MYSVLMNMHTKLSSKGQIAIPKELRDRMGLRAGASFEIVQRGGDLLLKTVTAAKDPIDWETFRSLMPPYNGPAKTIEEISSVSEEALREHYRREFPR